MSVVWTEEMLRKLIENSPLDGEFPCSTNQKALSAAENALLVSPFDPNAFWKNLTHNECVPCGAESELAEKVVEHAINVISSNVEAYDEDGRCNLKCANCNCRMLSIRQDMMKADLEATKAYLKTVKAELKTTKETLGVTARELDETMQELHWTNCALENVRTDLESLKLNSKDGSCESKAAAKAALSASKFIKLRLLMF